MHGFNPSPALETAAALIIAEGLVVLACFASGAIIVLRVMS